MSRRIAGLVAAALAVVAACAPSPAAAQTTAHELAFSAAADRSAAAPLAGATVSGDVFVFVRPDSGATQVRFYLDDPLRQRAPIKTEKNAPWDLAGTADSGGLALPWRTTAIGNGRHTITAAVDRPTGGTLVITAELTVRNVVAPDQVHVGWSGDPATTFDVIWRTRESATPSVAQVRPLGGTAWTTVTGAPRPSGAVGTLHEARVTGLSPSTAYEYRVQGDAVDGEPAWSPVRTTRTAPGRGPADFDAVYVADTGLIGRADGLTTGTKQVIDEIARLDPLFVLGGGDYAYYNTDTRFGTLENTIDAWFDQMRPVFDRAPIMPVYGNHETLLGEDVNAWIARFATPAGFDGRRNYSFDVGDVHFVALFAVEDRLAMPSAVIPWLEQDVAAARGRGQRWIVPFFHVAPFADGTNHPSNTALRAQLGPVFERLGVKVAIASHDQAYERSWPLVDVPRTNTPTSTSRDCYGPDDGVTWVKYSPGGKLSNISRAFSPFAHTIPPAWTAARDNTMHHFGRLRVSASGVLRLEAWGVKGDGTPPVIQDAFEYRLDGCPGQITSSESAVTLSAAEGDGAPAPRTVRFQAGGGAPAPITVGDDAAWLSVTPSSGASPLDVTLSVDPAGLTPGVHRATIEATSPGLTAARVPVTLTVTGDREIAVSAAADRSNAQPLDGRTISGDAYVFARPDTGVVRASFWLDNTAMTGTPRRVENSAPYDFAGGDATRATAFNTRTIADGTHTISVALDLQDGSREVAHATFTVRNAAAPPPPPPPPPAEPTHRLVYSLSADRSAPAPLDGATVKGNLYAFTDPEGDTRLVRFWLDNPDRTGSPRRSESNGPWDFNGGDTVLAKPFDTRSLTDGAHTITAEITRTDGTIEVVHGRFTVGNLSAASAGAALG